MKFYATIEPCRKLKHLFSNLSSFYIIDVDTILSESGLDINKPSHQFLLNTELRRLITNGAKSKRYTGIIYVNGILDVDTIINIKSTIDCIEGTNIDSVVLLDDVDVPKLKNYYKLFDEVIFFPSTKRMRILEIARLKKKRENENNSSINQ